MAEVEEVKPKRRFDKRDFSYIAEFIVAEHDRRKEKRAHLEKHWKEIDRQLRMEPDLSSRMDERGEIRSDAAWMPQLELPLQAQALEVLTADARRMMQPDNGSWFAAHALVDDEYLRKIDLTSIIAGDENDVPSKINQDNVDKLVEGFLNFYHGQYDFWGEWDRLNAEAFKYGTFVGALRIAPKSVIMQTARGVLRKETPFPQLVARSIKNTYLDENPGGALLEGFVTSPGILSEKWQRLADLELAISKGSDDASKFDGGWIKSAVNGLTPDKNGYVHLLEWEGDLIVPRRTTDSIYLPNVIVSVAIGAASDDNSKQRAVYRLRFNPFPFAPTIVQPYHIEDVHSPYGVGPLMKGRPIQKGASEAYNRLMAFAILNVEPPIKYDRDDAFYRSMGGPPVAPRALWPTVGDIQPVQIGEGNALLAIYTQLLSQYADVTGVNQPRLGAQTISHTTAFAKDAELSRGVVRTVDYVKSTLSASGVRLLSMEYEMALHAIGKRREIFYIDAYGGYVEVERDQLPDKANFTVFGAGGPAEERDKSARRLSSLQLALQVEVAARQLGGQANLDMKAMQESILREGGWSDIDAFLNRQNAQQNWQSGQFAPVGLLTGAAPQ